MGSGDINIFFSCSFSPEDAPVNELVRGVCAGLGLTCVNVCAGFSELPPEKAKEYISGAAGVIAVVTKRDRLESGEFIMPSAVREEISIAYGLDKDILIIGEKGVRFDGFMSNYGTRLPFSRDELTLPPFIEKLIFSVYTLRHKLASSEPPYQYAEEYVSESTRYLVSLDYHGSSYWWTSAVRKRLRFEAALLRDIPTSVWPDTPSLIPSGAPDPEWSVVINSSSRPFEIQHLVRDIAPDRIDLLLRFQPPPQQGDYIEYSRTFKSKYLNPLFADALPPEVVPAVTIDGRSYAIADGIVLVERTKKLHSHYSFPAEYGLQANDIAVFAGSHSFTIDYLAPWELKRVKTFIESFGPKLIADLHVEEPTPRHMYGLAWSPPTRKPDIDA